MPFDKPTRNALARMVGAARESLKEDIIAQLQTEFRLQPDGTTLSFDGLPPSGVAAADELRDQLQHYAAQLPSAGNSKSKLANQKSAFDRLAREIGFTILNRLAALRLCEERGLVVESVRKGMASEGFQLFERLTGGGLGPRYQAYRAFLENLFDELAIDLGALFDRGAPLSHVFPSERALEDVLHLLNDPALADLWKEDETIGWIYQYYNDEAERKKMRDESPVPRNSRELAVRNQFFTPRYVVEFLTDNTLGRLWYEMRGGETRLAEVCRYLVRDQRLRDGERSTNPQSPAPTSRAKKDPRTITMLDPAGGSGHFGLYCFDLFEIIYEEAYDEPDLGPALQADYPDRTEYLLQVPRLILAHNIHIIDIDERAVQIAALALWLRAQRSFQRLGLKATQRPQIRRVNVVCAEPMPNENDLLDEFVEALQPPELGELVRFVFDGMQLAGEAGSLLKIEEDLREEIEDLRKKAGPLFEGDSDFWTNAEPQVLAALRDYAEQASNGKSARRRLFADDAAHGFAFIDLCRKQYDVVLMNPPFGETATATIDYINKGYPDAFIDVLAAFVERAMQLCEHGRIGALTSRACLYTKTLTDWRKRRFLPSIETLADLGGGVLDGAMVFACASVLVSPRSLSVSCLAIDLRKSDSAELELLTALEAVQVGTLASGTYLKDRRQLSAINNTRFLYNTPDAFWQWLQTSTTLVSTGGSARAGSTTYDDFRFLRLVWEVPAFEIGWKRMWVFFSKGGYFETFYNDIHLLVNWLNDGQEVGEFNRRGYGTDAQSRRASAYYKRPGITYPRRTVKGFSPRAFPRDCIFADKGPVVFSPDGTDPGFSLGYLNSSPIRAFVHLQVQAGSFETGVVNTTPWLNSGAIIEEISKLANEVWQRKAATYRMWEVDRGYIPPSLASATSISKFSERLNKGWREDSEKVVALCQTISDLVCTEFSLPDIDFDSFEVSIQDHRIEDSFGMSETGGVGFYILSLAVGCVLGRWDIRLAIDPTLARKLQDPFDPLPACSPGMLIAPDGLPAAPGQIVNEAWLRARLNAITLPELTDDGRKTKDGSPTTIPNTEYPLRIAWDGILVDDPGLDGQTLHDADIVRRVREALAVLWADKAESIEAEACELLGVLDLRDYFRKPSGFFADHLKRYSKSRRQAPIYWPLSTTSGGYTVWVYYHRLTGDTLHTIVNRYVTPKIENTQQRAEVLAEKLAAASGKTATELRGQHDEAKILLSELTDFRAELLRVAALPYKPNLNDGVILNAAPLHKLFRLSKWAKDCKAAWDKLAAGEYEWAHVAYTIWPQRVEKACETDRSIAIAHGLEHLCRVEVKKPKAKRKKKGAEEEAETMEMDL